MNIHGKGKRIGRIDNEHASISGGFIDGEEDEEYKWNQD